MDVSRRASEGSAEGSEQVLEAYEEDFHQEEALTEGPEVQVEVVELVQEVQVLAHLNRLSVDSMQSITEQPSSMYSGALESCLEPAV